MPILIYLNVQKRNYVNSNFRQRQLLIERRMLKRKKLSLFNSYYLKIHRLQLRVFKHSFYVSDSSVIMQFTLRFVKLQFTFFPTPEKPKLTLKTLVHV